MNEGATAGDLHTWIRFACILCCLDYVSRFGLCEMFSSGRSWAAMERITGRTGLQISKPNSSRAIPRESLTYLKIKNEGLNK